MRKPVMWERRRAWRCLLAAGVSIMPLSGCGATHAPPAPPSPPARPSPSTRPLPSASSPSATRPIAPAGNDFHAEVAKTYDFAPHLLKDKALSEKSAVLDGFWGRVKARGEAGRADLREELKRSDHSAFFCYDGAKLLLSISDRREDKDRALQSIARCDLRDVMHNDYFDTVHKLAVAGFDTSDAAFNILNADTFSVDVPQHAMTLDQEMSLLYLLLPTDETFYVEKAKRRLDQETRRPATKSLLGLMGSLATDETDALVEHFANDPSKPAAARQYASQIARMVQQERSSFSFTLTSYEELKKQRTKLFARVSDEALLDWSALRAKLHAKEPATPAATRP